MSVKTQGKKNCSYYNFLRGIAEENLPVFSDEQTSFANYLSGLLPLVWGYEYEIIRCLLGGLETYQQIIGKLMEIISRFKKEEYQHALSFLQFVNKTDQGLAISVTVDDQFTEYLEDLISYGLTRFEIDNGDEIGFKLWQNYRIDQVQLKLLRNPGSNQKGTYYYEDYVVVFASLKKDLEEADRLNYKDKFLQADVFQWESMHHLPQSDYKKLTKSRYAYLFIRKVDSENGIVLPFTYVGTGQLTNPRKNDGGNGTYLFDIQMENELPEYLQYDFGLTKE
jgi:hypothetical protein